MGVIEQWQVPTLLGSTTQGSGSHVSFCSIVPPLEGPMGNKVPETQQEEATRHRRGDKLPREKEPFQPLKAVNPINSTATVDGASTRGQG